MVKAIAFDFGGVLGSDADEWGTTFRSVLDASGLSEKEMLKIWEKYWSILKLEKGNIMDYWQEAAKKNNSDPGRLRELYNQSIRIDNKVLDIAKFLAEKYKLIILSNNTSDWMETETKRFSLDSIFQKIYCSADIGMSKPDKKIFKYVIADLNIKTEELIFIDNQENNTKASMALGIKTILFTGPDELKKELGKLL